MRPVSDLIEVIEKFKKPKGVEWELHQDDIVINSSKWREIKKKFEEDTDYKKGFNILMDYWESLPDEEKADIDRRLKEVGL